MLYLPGRIHEKLQTEMFLWINIDFVISVSGEKRMITSLSEEFDTLTLKKGDVIVSRWFKPLSRYGDSEVYLYIESVISGDDRREIKTESTLSRDLVILNTQNKVLFTDLTKIYN